MTRALEKWDSVSRYDNPSQWVFRVGFNWAVSRWRRRKREVTGWPLEASNVDALPDPDITSALNELPTELRAVVVVRLYLDWSTEETAAALGIPAGTVKSRLSRALAKLEGSL